MFAKIMLKKEIGAGHYTLNKFAFAYLKKQKKSNYAHIHFPVQKGKNEIVKDAVFHDGSVRKKLRQAYFEHTDV